MDKGQQLEPGGMCADKNAVCTNFPDKSTNIRSPSALSLRPYISLISPLLPPLSLSLPLEPHLSHLPDITPGHPWGLSLLDRVPDNLWCSKALGSPPIPSSLHSLQWAHEEGRKGGETGLADWIWGVGPCGTGEGSQDSLAGSYPGERRWKRDW